MRSFLGEFDARLLEESLRFLPLCICRLLYVDVTCARRSMIWEFIFVQAPRKRFDLEHSFGHISPHAPEKGGVETGKERLMIMS